MFFLSLTRNLAWACSEHLCCARSALTRRALPDTPAGSAAGCSLHRPPGENFSLSFAAAIIIINSSIIIHYSYYNYYLNSRSKIPMGSR